jgi:hypothetical protein
MCCFSGPVASVRNTRIFARLGGGGTQLLAYQMEYSSKADENAMILPLPVRTPATEASVRFIDLGGYPGFFADLESGFPVRPPLTFARSKGLETVTASAAPHLAVQEVGDYVASFVPSMKDFERLDPRFRISADTWAKLPGYADYGFAVFQLKSREGRPHPMAFELTSRLDGQVYFPTVHIHDGEVHDKESFDHALYLQEAAFDAVVGDYEDHDATDVATGFVRSDRAAGEIVKMGLAQGLVDGALLVHKRELKGSLPNEDQLVGMPQASIVPPSVRRNVWPYGPLAIAGVGIGWIIARRRKLARRAQLNAVRR